MRRIVRSCVMGFIACGALPMLLPACGLPLTTFPHQLRAPDGQPILLDDLETIVNDDNLTDDEKRQQLRDLGLQDEELIDALLIL